MYSLSVSVSVSLYVCLSLSVSPSVCLCLPLALSLPLSLSNSFFPLSLTHTCDRRLELCGYSGSVTVLLLQLRLHLLPRGRRTRFGPRPRPALSRANILLLRHVAVCRFTLAADAAASVSPAPTRPFCVSICTVYTSRASALMGSLCTMQGGGGGG